MRQLLCLPLLFAPALALADTSWIADAKTCDAFSVGVLKVYASIEGNVPTALQQEEIRQVIAAACRPEFSECKFTICRPAQAEAPADPPAETPEPTPEPLASLAPPDEPFLTPPDVNPTEAPVAPTSLVSVPPEEEEEPFPKDEVPHSGRPTLPETLPTTMPLPDPPAWTFANMSCADFLSQLRTRYGRTLNEPQRSELAAASRVACSARFKHCNFEACRK